jgi:L-serine dehydratase
MCSATTGPDSCSVPGEHRSVASPAHQAPTSSNRGVPQTVAVGLCEWRWDRAAVEGVDFGLSCGVAFISIFNDVLGPVMRGPSSSHTAGAYHIARLARDLAGALPRTIRCAFDPDGSYAPTYGPLGVDLAFAAGFLGWQMTDERYPHALQAISEAGTDLRFDVVALEHADHPNSVRVIMEHGDGSVFVLWARSVGGGLVELARLDEWELSVDGKSWVVLVELRGDADAAVRRLLGDGELTRRVGGRVLCQALLQRPPAAEALQELRRDSTVRRVMVAEPVFLARAGESLFATADEMVALATRRGWSLGRSGREYEARLLGRTNAEVEAEMTRRYSVMKAAVAAGLDDRNANMPLTRPSAARILRAEQNGTVAAGGLHTRAAARAMAVMHVCNSRGVVCAAPTGGSCGVIPGVLVSLEQDRGLPPQAVRDALFAAGAVGLIVARRATFAAEVAGCQVEIGVAGAMAAAAVVDACGGTAAQAVAAAAVALQNTMGSVCDPVGGGCEIPCHSRNAVAAANAFVVADLVMGGYVNPIGLDETIDASYAVGRALPRELRCTALGGIAATPSARALATRRTSAE